MKIATAAVVGEIISPFISFLMNKYRSLCHAKLEEDKVVERLQYLLIRASTIMEEADKRYITNSGMLIQLKTLSQAMYQGDRVLDMSRYRALQSHGALESLEIAVANMKDFVVLLGGCERMSRRPYDVYVYADNFMFSRHAEKQKLLIFLLQHNDLPGYHALPVLPIIGGAAIGKKTLVAHACSDERVRSRFSILHLNGDNLMMALDQGRIMFGMVLVIIEFASDVGDDEWRKFHTFVITMGRGTKIIIISRLQRIARFGSVKPIFLSMLSYDEIRYLFKTLAFESIDPAQHPRLVKIADEYAEVLHSTQGSLVSTNTFADVLRRNLDIQFWRCVLDKGLRMVKRNLSMYGVPPSTLAQQGQPVDITDIALHPLSMTTYTSNVSFKKELPSVTFGELITDPSVKPKGDFTVVTWESRMPPHKSFANFVTSHAQGKHEGCDALLGRKRRGVPI